MSRSFLAVVRPVVILPGLVLVLPFPVLADDPPRPWRAEEVAADASPVPAEARDARPAGRLARAPFDRSADAADDAPLDLPRPWRCGTVVVNGRPRPLGNSGYSVYPLALGDDGGVARYRYCVFPAAARATAPR